MVASSLKDPRWKLATDSFTFLVDLTKRKNKKDGNYNVFCWIDTDIRDLWKSWDTEYRNEMLQPQNKLHKLRRRCSSVVKASALRGQDPGFDSRWNPSQTYNAVDKKGGASWFLWGILPTSLKIEWSHQMINRYTMWLNGYVQCYDDDKFTYFVFV